MAGSEIVKRYPKDEINIVWKPAKCIHAGECVKRLPEVYNPKAKPWINPENAASDEIRKQVAACPSGALSIESANPEKLDDNATHKAEVLVNGPLMIKGSIKIVNTDGSTEVREKAAFCRCGASSNKPYCDGSHKKIDFQG